MTPTITLSALTHRTPDGHLLFEGLDFTFGAERTGLVGRNGVGKSTLLDLIAGRLPIQAGSIAIAGTLARLDQRPAAQAETLVDLFGVGPHWTVLARAEAGQASLEEFAECDWTLPTRMAAALERFGLDLDPATPLARLSGGQRTRAALAALIFAEPEIIALDEPTNNLDREGRNAVASFLSGWHGTALVASHDRDLLEMMDAIVDLSPLGAARYGGPYSAYVERKARERAAAEHDLCHAQKALSAQKRKRQQARERKARTDASGRRKRASNDAPKILLDAMADRAGRTDGTSARLGEARIEEAQAAAAAARARVEVLTPLSVTLAPSQLPAGRLVLQARDLAIGHERERPLARNLDIALVGPERVALIGPNGSGKSTFLSVLTGGLPALAGSAAIAVPYAVLDQDITLLDPYERVRDAFLVHHPGAGENACRAALARFAFRAEAALQPVATLSGGERLRAGLAVILGGPNPPQLLVLDEPTNHLDLDAIAAVEAGLNAYDGALLVVSHDRRFLAAIGVDREIVLGQGD